MHKPLFSLLLSLFVVACSAGNIPTQDSTPLASSDARNSSEPQVNEAVASERLATFSGGCFWCMEVPFEELPGVSAVISGYTDGQLESPTYKQVCTGTTGHAESIQVHYDPSRISYESLLEVFWRQINPTDGGGQFVDRGNQYRSGIYYHDQEQKEAALKSKQALAASGRFKESIVTEIKPYGVFYKAEEYHQDYHHKQPEHYQRYRKGSGRDRYLDEVWGVERDYAIPVLTTVYKKPSEEQLRARLTDLQYRVTQEAATEHSFKNEYWDNKQAGIYVDIVSGEPLFSSLDKFKSGTGWPSFSRPLLAGNIKQDVDHELGYARDEVRSQQGNSHLGHVFSDGPEPTGLRYCINSAALRFIPKDQLKAEGYGQFEGSFE